MATAMWIVALVFLVVFWSGVIVGVPFFRTVAEALYYGVLHVMGIRD